MDPNVRLQLWPSAAACRDALCGLLARADMALLGDEDAATLYPGLDEEDVVRVVQALGPRTVVLKQGERGALARRDDEWARVAAYPVTVVDTVGAGDGFDAGFVAGWLRGFNLAECLALGARVGAAAVAATGDWEGYPTAAELGLPLTPQPPLPHGARGRTAAAARARTAPAAARARTAPAAARARGTE